MRQLPTQVRYRSPAAVLFALLLVGCAGTPGTVGSPAAGKRSAAGPINPWLEEALTLGGLNPRAPLIAAGEFKRRAPPLDTSRLSWFNALSGDAGAGPDFQAKLINSLDRSVAGARPVSDTLSLVMDLNGTATSGESQKGLTGGDVKIPEKVPAELRRALAPVLAAMVRVSNTGPGTPAMSRAAVQLAAAVEQAHLERFAGLEVSVWWHVPGLGRVILGGPGDDTYNYSSPETVSQSVALLLDTGGSDNYLMPAGANTRGENLVSVHVDLGGNDRYNTQGAGQGSGQQGVGLLWDLGKGSDHYLARTGGQGSGGKGVGVLLDDGGDDIYRGERGVQGAGQEGVGLLLDLAGDDRYETFTRSQGFGGPGGVGILFDGAGDDHYQADPGDPAQGGELRFPSPQLPKRGNASLSQGAAAGVRDDAGGRHQVGGIGVLRDRSGEDSYIAGVFAQGCAYWYAVGMLADGGGKDQYDALWYGQGAAAHFALGIFRDEGGDDRYNQRLLPVSSSLGLGHDLAVGWHIDLGGNDLYRAPPLSLGKGSSDGSGIMFNRGGEDKVVKLGTGN